MELPGDFGKQEFEEKEQEPEFEEPVKEITSLQDIVITDVGRISNNLRIASEPWNLDDFGTRISNYNLTPENIEGVIFVEYKDKTREEWLDVYIIEYKEEKKMEKDFPGLLFRKKQLEGEKGVSLNFLVKDCFIVLAHNQHKELEESVGKVLRGYKRRFGMKELKETRYVFE